MGGGLLGVVSLESRGTCKAVLIVDRDVAAGVCILEEAGGLVTTAKPPEDIETAKVEDAKLGSRLYLAIRAAGDSEGESGRQAQERLVREVWKRVHTLDYNRPGI